MKLWQHLTENCMLRLKYKLYIKKLYIKRSFVFVKCMPLPATSTPIPSKTLQRLTRRSFCVGGGGEARGLVQTSRYANYTTCLSKAPNMAKQPNHLEADVFGESNGTGSAFYSCSGQIC